MELGTERPSLLWFWGPNFHYGSVYGPSGYVGLHRNLPKRERFTYSSVKIRLGSDQVQPKPLEDTGLFLETPNPLNEGNTA